MGMFKHATKTRLQARVAIHGPSGSGKSYTSLLIAQVLAAGKPVAVVDTEHGSASKYADLFSFDVLELSDFHPDRYVEAIKTAVAEGYGAIILDSLSHAWNSKNGILDLVAQIEQRKYHGNKDMRAWADVKPIETRLIEAIVGSPIHILATMRSKTEYVQEQDERGRSKMRKVGLAPVQRDGMEYEFDLVLDMNLENTGVVQKSRCPALAGAIVEKPGQAFAQTLLDWLNSGDAAPVAPPPVHRPPAPVPAQEPEDSYDDAPPPPEDWDAPAPSPALAAVPGVWPAVPAPAQKPAAKPATRTAPPADHQGPDKAGAAIASQLSSIRNLCKLTREQEPTGPMTFQEAAGLIGKLSELYKAQKAQHGQSGAGAAGASRPAGGSSAHAAPPAKAPATAAKSWQLLSDAKLIVKLGNHGITGVEEVEAWAAKADAIYSDQEGMDLKARCYALLETMDQQQQPAAKAGA